MNYPHQHLIRRLFQLTLSASCLGGLLFIAGCETTKTVSVSSSIEGTAISVNSAPLGRVGATPTVLQFPPLTDTVKSYEVTFTADTYFPESLTLTGDQMTAQPYPLPKVQLVPKTISKKVRMNASPEDVVVYMNGKQLGKTDLTTVLTFARESKTQPFPTITLTFKKQDYQDETVTLSVDQYPNAEVDLPMVKLQRLRHVKTYKFRAVAQSSDNGALQGIPVDVLYDGALVGKTSDTAYSIDVEYVRSSKDQPWPKHKLALTLADQFKTETRELSYTSALDFDVQMEPVTEFMVEDSVPRIEVPARGAEYRLRSDKYLAMRDMNESSESAVANLTQVTGYRRPEVGYKGKLQSVNSFTPTPDGEFVVYGLTIYNIPGQDASAHYSNLILKGVTDAGSFVSQITSTERYCYTEPRFGVDGKNVLVFSGNAENLRKPDIYRAELDKGYAISGGITRLTSGSPLFASPAFRDVKERIYFISYEPEYAQAKSRLGSVQFDGSLPTMLGIEGQEPKPGPDGTIYFTRRDSVTGKLQLYKAAAGGRQETRLIQDPNFSEANCYDFDLDAKGERLLFVSDRASSGETADCNIYMIDLREGVSKAPMQITYNRSRDYSPRWVPAIDSPYSNRVFFLSNRGGVVNVWYVELQAK